MSVEKTNQQPEVKSVIKADERSPVELVYHADKVHEALKKNQRRHTVKVSKSHLP